MVSLKYPGLISSVMRIPLVKVFAFFYGFRHSEIYIIYPVPGIMVIPGE